MRKRGRPKHVEPEIIEQPKVREEDIEILEPSQGPQKFMPLEGEGVKDTDPVKKEDWDPRLINSDVEEKEDFAEKIQTIAVKTEPRTHVEVPVTLRVKGQNVVRMRKRHMTKG